MAMNLLHDSIHRSSLTIMFKANVANNISFNIYFLDDIKCNGTETHIAFVGEKITYACSFKYQGMLPDRYVQFRGERGRVLITKKHVLSKFPVGSVEWGRTTRYKGELTVRK